MNLKQGTLLKHGEYRIERELGQGGFGITYLAVQLGLNRRVAIKEFFKSEYCNRDADTSHVTVGSEGSKELVARFRAKFIKEAQNIACLKHPHIISIHDVFEDNGTAYYVMEYLEYGSLADLVKRQGRLPEADALRYIRQIADALRYIHERKMNHLDVKPDNILVDETDHAVLIDFGISKHYDDEGKQTSTTPVGISRGYAPLEQYKKSGVGTFSPATDIYSLGATLYKLVTGDTPPDADDVLTDGLPLHSDVISPAVFAAIEQAMQPNRNKRPQTVDAFLALLAAEEKVNDECTVLDDAPRASLVTPFWKKLLLPAVACLAVVLAVVFWPKGGDAPVVPVVVPAQQTEILPPSGRQNDTGQSQSTASSVTTSGNRKTYTVNGVSFTMVRVAGGTFTMGASSGDGDADDDEKPAHQVTLSSYSIGETEVTQALWQAVMGSNPSHFTGNLQRPVEKVSWNDCQAFIRKLNSLTGVTFRLPTEAEWEYAARGGSQSRGYKYSGSDNLGTVAWYTDNSSNTTHPVKGKRPNELGLYDMSGNVWEWCSDWFDSSYYANSPSSNPKGPSAGSNRVYRGGSWIHYAGYCRVSYRDFDTPSFTYSNLGLRLASQ